MIINRIPRAYTAGVPWDLSANTAAQFLCDDNLATKVAIDVEGTDGTSTTNTEDLHIAGPFGTGAFDFATNQYIDMNQAFQTTLRSACSFSAWIKPDDGQPADANCILGTYNGNPGAFLLRVEPTGKIYIQYRETGHAVVATSTSAVFANGATSWTNVLCTLDSTSIKLYINSVDTALDNNSMSTVTMANYTNTRNCFIASQNALGTPVKFFNGGLKDFRVMDRVTTQAEIDGIYNSGSGTEAQKG